MYISDCAIVSPLETLLAEPCKLLILEGKGAFNLDATVLGESRPWSSRWDWAAVKPVSSVQNRGSLIPGLIILSAARPQLCLCSPLILSICVWDRGGTPVLYLALSPSPSPPSIIRVKPKIKRSPDSERFIWHVFWACLSGGMQECTALLGLHILFCAWTNSGERKVFYNDENQSRRIKGPKIPFRGVTKISKHHQ